MRKSLIVVLATLVSLAVLTTAALAAPPHPQPRNFVAPLNADEEVPTPGPTRARGVAIFQLSRDGTQLSYRLIASNIENVTQAHIHLGPRGEAGPVVLWLYPEGPPAELIEGRHDGVLATGTVTAGDLVGPLAGESMDDLIGHITSGNAYVNVHTAQNPPGEIRGQLD